jgi:uncharacterized membrane protein
MFGSEHFRTYHNIYTFDLSKKFLTGGESGCFGALLSRLSLDFTIAVMSREKISPGVLESIRKPQNVFLLLELFFGLLFVFVTPPALVGDEPNHFFRAYQISEGHIIGERRDNLSGGWLPESVLSTNRKLTGNIEMNPDVKFDVNLISELLYLPLEPEKQLFERFPNTVVYAPVAYLPQVLGILTGKLFAASPLVMIYLARIANLLFFMALAFAAIRTTPVHKWVFCLLCLTPTAVFQVASASVDAFTYGICFLTIAVFLSHGVNEDGRLGSVDLFKIFALCLLAVLSKQAYIFLPLLFLLIPRRKVGSTSRYLLIFSSLFAVCLIAEAVWSSLVKAIYLPYRNDMPINPEQQVAFIINNPLNFIGMAAQNYILYFGYYFKTFFGQLTWFDLYVPTYLTVFTCLVIVIAALLDKDSKKTVSKLNKFIFLSIIAGTAFLISALLYMTWSPIGGDSIEGIQGRYFIPVAPLIFLLFYQHRLEWKHFTRFAPVIVAVTVIFSLIITLWTVYHRYYV